MGSTYVEFNGKGFEASDSQLEIWLILLIGEIDRMEKPPGWIKEVRDEWHLQATAGFGFGVIPDLDGVITDDERRQVILRLCDQAIQRLNRYGAVMTKSDLAALDVGGNGTTFEQDVPTEIFRRAGEYFIKLLEDRLGPEMLDARFPPIAE